MAICPFTERRSPRPSATLVLTWVWSSLGLLFFLVMAGFLLLSGLPAFRQHGLRLVTQAGWHYRAAQFGAVSMLYGTAVVALIAISLAVPLAIGSAIATSEYLSGVARLLVKGLIELLAGIPSVVYGLLGVLFLRPLVFRLFQPWRPETGDNLLTAGLLVGIMIVPTVMSLADDALRSVPRRDREAAWALGLTRCETFLHAVLPRAFPGLVSAVLLGLGRALGETIAVYLVVGRADNRLPQAWCSLRPLLEPGQTLTSKLGGAELSIAYGHHDHWAAMIALSLVLCVVVLGCTVIGQRLLVLGRKYDG